MSMTKVDAMGGKRERGWPPWLLHESPSSSTLICASKNDMVRKRISLSNFN